MNRQHTPARYLLAILLVSSGLPLLAQTILPAAPNNDQSPTAANFVPTSTSTSDESEEVVQLSPFVVNASQVQGYMTSDTLAGTRVRTNLDDLGSAISVIDSKFLADTGSKNAQDLLVYTLGTEVGGLYGNYTGTGNANELDENSLLINPNNDTRVRGLATADNTRDYFTSDIPWDGYNIGRIDISRGANAILFGTGSPAGIINASTNGAAFKDANQVTWTYGQFGSSRGALDINKVLLPNELAVRVEFLDDGQFYRENPTYNRDKRGYAAARYDPSFLNKHGIHTSLTVNYEQGTVNSNNPRILPPIDKITPWFNSMNKATYNGITSYSTYDPSVPGSGASTPGNPNYQPWLANEGLYGGPIAYFTNPASSQESGPLIDSGAITYFGLGPNGQIDHGIAGLPFARGVMIGEYSQYSLNANLPFSSTLNPYKDTYLSDPTIFNFYDQLLDGPNKAEWQGFQNTTIQFSQTYWKQRLGIQAIWNIEHYNNGSITTLNDQDDAITVDINQVLTNGLPNPNVGRPMVYSRAAFDNTLSYSTRVSSRYTATADLRADDFLPASWLTKVLGEHELTAAYTEDKHDAESRSYERFAMDPSYNALSGTTGLNEVMYVSYLGPSIANASSAHGLNLSNLQAVQLPTSTTIEYYNSNWQPPVSSSAPGYVDPGAPWITSTGTVSTQSENPANYGGWSTATTGVLVADNGATNNLITYAQKSRDVIKSSVFVWQGHLLDDIIVPTWSFRHDSVTDYNVNPPLNPNNTYNVFSSAYSLPSTPNNVISGNTRSLSVVVHTPKFLRKHLWKDTDIGLFYNKSSNFQDLAGRVGIYNDPLPPPTGDTKDRGVMITTWNGKVKLRVDWYDTKVLNDSSSLPNDYVIGYAEYMMYTNAENFQLGLSGDPAYSIANTSWRYNFLAGGNLTQAQATAIQTAAVNAALSNLASDAFFNAWGITKGKSSDWLSPNYFDLKVPTGLTPTQNSESKGMECELNFEPAPGWSFTMNASRDSALYTSLEANFQAYIEHFNTIMQGPAGDLPEYYGGYYGAYGAPGVNAGMRTLWNSFYSGYLLNLALQNGDLPEIRQWHYNFVGDHTFTDGFLKGCDVGVGFRWESKVAIGYPVYHDTTLNTDTFDVAHPFWGPSDQHFDLWVGYQRKLTNRLGWRIQLNVRNVGESPHLVPISMEPDGKTWGAVRIADGQLWQVTNTFTF